ncbi:hypothetical protein LQZ18_08365 [Lachnospiraceae bacterium ZAX-1]
MDINLHLMDMPSTVSGYTVINPDSSYTIFLNARLTYERQLAAYMHEMEHIQENDFENEIEVNYIEDYRHVRES